MAQASIVLKPRETGRAASKRCRQEGLVPGIIYGKSIEPIAIAVDAKTFRQLAGYGRTQVHHVSVEGSGFEGNVMVQDVAYEPLTGRPVHIDLHRISMTDKVKADVPVIVQGEEALEKRGLILQRQLREITVECLPADIPSEVTVDVSALQHGESVTAGEVALPEEVRLVTDAAEVIVVIVSPRVGAAETEEEDSPAEGEPEEEPEGTA
ncbi:MAG: 50S ribosomal protein L25 [Bacillota bacterium]|nr:50S ribosomal protein L25 [Candidatus Fermentithermobacillaceae bacterium]